MNRYEQEFRRSLADPEGFWGDAAKDIDWYQAPTVVLDRSRPPFYRWFADGVNEHLLQRGGTGTCETAAASSPR